MTNIRVTDDQLSVHTHQIFLRVIGLFFFAMGIVIVRSGTSGLGAIFSLVGFGVFLLGGPVSITARRSSDRLVIRKGGLFGFGARTTEHRLSLIARADLEVALTVQSQQQQLASNVIFTGTDGERLPLIKFPSTDLGQHRRIVEAFNRFISRGQFGLPSVREVFEKAVTQPAGTVLLYSTGRPGLVRFAITPAGLMFFEPRAAITISIGTTPQGPFERVLKENGFVPVAGSGTASPGPVAEGTYILTPTGIYANFGRDIARAEAFAPVAFGVYHAKNATLEASFDPADVYLRMQQPLPAAIRIS